MKRLLLSIALTLGYTILYGQQPDNALNTSLQNLIPPSPNASALQKFGNIPVGPSTGIPQVNVPIYTWKGSYFNFPFNISLDYHAGGVKVDDQPSNVGINWALNAGGVISRTVRGIYDELPQDGFLYKTLPVNDTEGNLQNSIGATNRLFYRMHSGMVDSQCDIFNYNFNGRTGGFMLGKNNDILMLQSSKLRVEKTVQKVRGNDLINGFTIIDENGYKYIFGQYEITTTGIYFPSSFHTSSWYLTEIRTPNESKKIELKYEDYTVKQLKVSDVSTWAYPEYNAGYYMTRSLSGSGVQDIDGKRLKEISFPDGVIATFDYQTNIRQDVNTNYSTDRLLRKITINDGINLKGFLLGLDYSLGGRATLKSVTPCGKSESDLSTPYTFEYNPLSIPRFSAGKDHWGYPNNNHGGQPIPQEYVYNYYKLEYDHFTGGNRNTDPDLVKAGSLIQINYPTGGYTKFEMEANRAIDDYLYQTVVLNNPNPTNDITTSSSINGSMYPASNTSFVYTGENGNVSFKLSVPAYATAPIGSSLRFEFLNNNYQLITSRVIELKASSSNDYNVNFGIPSMIKNETIHIKVYAANLTGYTTYYSLTRNELKPVSNTPAPPVDNRLFVGGLRARKISDYVPNRLSPVSEREFEYLMESGVSSGVLGYRPIYSYKVAYGSFNCDEYSGCPPLDEYPMVNLVFYTIRSSSSVNDIPMISGAPVTYKRVVEYQRSISNSADNGKIVRTFTTFADNPPKIDSRVPFVPTSFSTWEYGLLKSEDIYTSGNTLLKSTVNDYSYVNEIYAANSARMENFRSITIAPTQFKWIKGRNNNYNPGVDPKAEPTYFIMNSFYPVAGRSELVKTTITEYNSNSAPIVTTTKNLYDINNYYLTQKEILDSRDVSLKTTYLRPKEMIAEGIDVSLHNEMSNANIIDPIIEERVTKADVIIEISRAKFKKWATGFFAPETMLSRTGSQTVLEPKSQFLKYNDFGNPIEVKQESGIPISYMWGIQEQFPIAEVKNASVNDIAYSSFEREGEKGGWTYQEIVIFDSKHTPTLTEVPWAATGRKVFSLVDGNSGISKSGLDPQKKYVLSFYYYSNVGAPSVTGTIKAQRIFPETNARYVEYEVTGRTNVSIGGVDMAIDELRLYPKGAEMKTFTYEPLLGINSAMDARGELNRYEYDNFQRLKCIKDESGNIIKAFTYHYRGE